MNHPVQGDLFATSAKASAESLRRFLSEAGDCRVDLTLTRNRVTMASVAFVTERHARVRLHAHFITAPEDIWNALAAYLRTRRRRDWNRVAAFSKTIDTSSEAKREPVSRLSGKGRIYDLSEIGKAVNQRFFSGRVRYQIGWGRNRPERRKGRGQRGRSIRFGSWSRTTHTIRVHPLLDDERVPQEFVEYIVFHEMLHAVVPSDCSSGRRYDHPETFRVLERNFPKLPEMKQLAGKLLRMLV